MMHLPGFILQKLDNVIVDVNGKVAFYKSFKLLDLKSAESKLHLTCTVHASII